MCHRGSGFRSWGGRIRTYDPRDQNPVPYHLATPHYLNRRFNSSRHFPLWMCHADPSLFVVIALYGLMRYAAL